MKKNYDNIVGDMKVNNGGGTRKNYKEERENKGIEERELVLLKT